MFIYGMQPYRSIGVIDNRDVRCIVTAAFRRFTSASLSSTIAHFFRRAPLSFYFLPEPFL